MKVAAVVVSYNRKLLLTECLDALLRQTLPLDKIYLIENASTDGTLDLLRERGYLTNPLIECIALNENTGGAGGFHEGLKRAVEAGFDWAWLMDDDAEPLLDAYALCRPELETPGRAIVVPNIAHADGSPDFTGTHRAILYAPKEAKLDAFGRSVTPEEVEGRTTLEIDVCSFVGPFISARAVAAVGLPRKEFFIHNDDTEYTLRARRFGPIVLVPGALIKHKQAQIVGQKEDRKTLFGTRSRLRYDRLWSRFYGYRNMAAMIRAGLVPTTLRTLLVTHLIELGRVIAFDDNKRARVSFWNTALLDGLRGEFDNTKPHRWRPKPT